LAEGECPSCGTTNDSSRKFCKKRECAAPLRVSCLSCEEQIPVWEEICGECGGNQQELLPHRRDLQKIKRQLEAKGKEAVEYNDSGLAHFNKGDFAAAITDYTKAIRLNPEEAIAYYNRGSAHHKNGDFDAAITDFTEAIRLNPEYAEALKYRGYLHKKMRNRAEAKADLRKAKELGFDP
jgi:tetratricopeptide (TPR) repeat protein